MKELALRFVVGGLAVCVFAVLGDLFKPKSFAGLFAAAPSVALASLILAVRGHGAAYATAEARSMIAGGVAFLVYASWVTWSLHTRGGRPRNVALVATTLWAVVAAVGWALFLRRT